MSTSGVLDSTFCLHVTLTLAHLLWQGLVIAILAAGAARCLRGAPAQSRYLVHVAALLLMVVCLPVTFAAVRIAWASAAVSVPETPRPPASSPAVAQASAAPHPVEDKPPTEGQPTAPAGKPAAASESIGFNWQRLAPYATGAYFAGVLGMFARLLLALRGGRRLRRCSRAIEDPDLLEAVRRQAERLKLRFVPVVAYCERVTVPVVIGVIRPMILLPIALGTGLTPDQVQAILTHELAHLRRYDHLVNVLQRLVEAILFFHPAVWYVSWRIKVEREHCCDDLVVATGARRCEYAESLVRVAEMGLRANEAAGGDTRAALSTSSGSMSRLRERVLRLFDSRPHEKVRLSRSWPVLLILIGVVVVASLLMDLRAGPAAEKEEGKPGATQASKTSGRTIWGKAVNGLQLGVRLFRSEYGFDDAFVASEIILRNVSDKTLSVVGPEYAATARILTHERQAVPMAPDQGSSQWQINREANILKAGESVSVRDREFLSGYLISTGGRYLLQVEYEVTPEAGKKLDWAELQIDGKDLVGWSGKLVAEAAFTIDERSVVWGKPVGPLRAGVILPPMEYGQPVHITALVRNGSDEPVTVRTSAPKGKGKNPHLYFWKFIGKDADGKVLPGVGLGYPVGGKPQEPVSTTIAPGRYLIVHNAIPADIVSAWINEAGILDGGKFRLEARFVGHEFRDEEGWSGEVSAEADAHVTVTPWGEESHGLRTRVRLNKQHYRVGQGVHIAVDVLNTTDKAITVGIHDNLEIDIRVTDADGRPVTKLREQKNPGIAHRILQAHERRTLTGYALDWQYDLLGPGRYRVQYTAWPKVRQGHRALPTSNAVEFEVLPNESEPADDSMTGAGKIVIDLTKPTVIEAAVPENARMDSAGLDAWLGPIERAIERHLEQGARQVRVIARASAKHAELIRGMVRRVNDALKRDGGKQSVTLSIQPPGKASPAEKLIRAVLTRPWSGKAYPERPALTHEVKQGVAEELAANAKTKASYEKLDPNKQNVMWFAGVQELAEAKAVWCLTSGLCHASDDVQVRCARALGELRDRRPVSFMLVVAETFAVWEEGSENATTHGVFQHALSDALNGILGTSVKLKDGQDPAGLKEAVKVWGAAVRGTQDKRRFPEAEVFINNRRFGPANGLTAGLKVTGSAECGHPGHVSRIKWKFLESTAEGDVFHFARTYPADGENPNTREKTIAYRGKPIVIFEDDVQRIGIRPKTGATPPAATSTTQPEVKWGQAASGLRCGLTADKPEVPMGSKVDFILHLRFDPKTADPKVGILNRTRPHVFKVGLTFTDTKTGKMLRRAAFDIGMMRSQVRVPLKDKPLEPENLEVYLLTDAGEQIPAGTYSVTATCDVDPSRVRVDPPPKDEVRAWAGRIVSGPVPLTVTPAEPKTVAVKVPTSLVFLSDNGRLAWDFSEKAMAVVSLRVRPGFNLAYRISWALFLNNKPVMRSGGGGSGGYPEFMQPDRDNVPVSGAVGNRVLAGGKLKVAADLEIIENSAAGRQGWSPVGPVLHKARIEGVATKSTLANLVRQPEKIWGTTVDGLQTRLAAPEGGATMSLENVELFLLVRNVSAAEIKVDGVGDIWQFVTVKKEGMINVPGLKPSGPAAESIRLKPAESGGWAEVATTRLDRIVDLKPGTYTLQWRVPAGKASAPLRVPPPSNVLYLKVARRPDGRLVVTELPAPVKAAITALDTKIVGTVGTPLKLALGGTGKTRIELEIDEVANSKPKQYVVQFTVVDTKPGGTEVFLPSPKLFIQEGIPSGLKVERENGNRMEIEMTVTEVPPPKHAVQTAKAEPPTGEAAATDEKADKKPTQYVAKIKLLVTGGRAVRYGASSESTGASGGTAAAKPRPWD